MTGPEEPGADRRIRPARDDELALLRDIEFASGEPFRAIGMAEVAEEEPMALAEIAHFQRAGRAWVVTGERDPDRPVGFLLAEPVDERQHIAQVSVLPEASGRRLGRDLIEHLAHSARAGGAAGLSLTTFVHVPWNAPYYRRLGFAELPEPELGPGLRAIRDLERTAGLDRWPRLAMVRRFGSTS